MIERTATPVSTERVNRAFRAFNSPTVRRILVVDDEDTIRLALERFLKARGFEVVTADSGLTALQALEREQFILLLCDVRMPHMSGLQVVPRALAIDSDLAVMMLTAVNDAPTATEALGAGAFDYLMKPLELPELERAIERALHRRELQIDRRNVERRIREEVALRTAELEREKAMLREVTIGVAETLINAMEAKDVYLRGHSQRVAELGACIAEEMRLPADTVEQVRLAGRLHDVGKIGIREAVLNKPGPLTPEEFDHVKDHVRIGMEILAPLRHIGPALSFIHDHHEHWDGAGYPRGLQATNISVGGRILAAADAYDSLTSKRAYRDPMSAEKTIDFLAAHVGKLLDPDIYAAMRAVVGRRQTLVFIDDMHA